jgi:GR25 family glycosyltransferase involved in LPS biosynthesis
MSITDTYIINLQSRPQRREFALNQAIAYKLTRPQVLVASTPTDRRPLLKTGSNLSPEEKACCVSHIRVWEKQTSNEAEWIMVMEDDAFCTIPVLQLHEAMHAAIQIAPLHVDCINLGAKKLLRTGENRLVASKNAFELNQHDSWNMHCYLIRKSACATWSQLAWTSGKPVDLIHQLEPLRQRYYILDYRGPRKPVMDVPKASGYLSKSCGLFDQIRGNTFESDIMASRIKNRAKKRAITKVKVLRALGDTRRL